MTKKILLINDMPGYGKVAISAMTPVLVHKGFEVFSLPTMLVSNTLNYGKFASLDTTQYMKDCIATWKELGFRFDVISTGFIANDEQADFIAQFCKQQSEDGVVIFTDPIMADNGKLYNSVTPQRVEIMKRIIAVADHIVPNMTEACLLLGREYCSEGYTESELYEMARGLHDMGAKSVIITSALLSENVCGKPETCKTVVGYDHKKGEYFIIKFDEVPIKINGSGDTFSAIVLSDVAEGAELKAAVERAVRGIRELILKDLDVAREYNGLPIEAGLDII